MKAKDIARQINQAVEQHAIQAGWDAARDRLVAGESQAAVLPAMEQVQGLVAEHIQRPATDFLAHLVESLGREVFAKGIHKTVSARAAVLAADQAWRAFHHRLAPLPARLVDPEGFRRTLEKKVPAVASMAWGNAGPMGWQR